MAESHKYRDRVSAWALADGRGWLVRSSGAKYSLRSANTRVALFYGANRHVTCFVDRLTPADLSSLDPGLLAKAPRHDPIYNGTTVLVRPEALETFLSELAAIAAPSLPARPSPVLDPGSNRRDRETEGGAPLGTALRDLLSPGWPHSFSETVAAEPLGLRFEHHRPVYIVGRVDVLTRPLVVFVGTNPNIRDRTECSLIDKPFTAYWETRLHYFTGPSFNWKHYKPHAALLAGLLGWAEPPDSPTTGGQLLEHLALAVELSPLSSRSPGDLYRHLDSLQNSPTHPSFGLARQALRTVVELGRPMVVIARYKGAYDFLGDRWPSHGDKDTVPALRYIGGGARFDDSVGRGFALGKGLRSDLGLSGGGPSAARR